MKVSEWLKDLSENHCWDIVDGEVVMAGKGRGQKKALEVLRNLIKEAGGIDYSMPYTIMWAGTDPAIAEKYIDENMDLWEEGVRPSHHVISSTVGSHLGPGSLGLAFFKKCN